MRCFGKPKNSYISCSSIIQTVIHIFKTDCFCFWDSRFLSFEIMIYTVTFTIIITLSKIWHNIMSGI